MGSRRVSVVDPFAVSRIVNSEALPRQEHPRYASNRSSAFFFLQDVARDERWRGRTSSLSSFTCKSISKLATRSSPSPRVRSPRSGHAIVFQGSPSRVLSDVRYAAAYGLVHRDRHFTFVTDALLPRKLLEPSFWWISLWVTTRRRAASRWLSLFEIISRRSSPGGHIFHCAFNAKYDRSIPEPYLSIVKWRLNTIHGRVYSILKCTRLEIKNCNADQFI